MICDDCGNGAVLTLQVLAHARGGDALRQDDRLSCVVFVSQWTSGERLWCGVDTHPALDVPRDDDLCRRDAELLRDLLYLGYRQAFLDLVVAPEGRVRLQEQTIVFGPLRVRCKPYVAHAEGRARLPAAAPAGG